LFYELQHDKLKEVPPNKFLGNFVQSLSLGQRMI